MIEVLHPLRILSSLFFNRRCSFATATIKDILKSKPIDRNITVKGWVQAIREYKELFFVDLIDGTCLDRLQIIVNAKNSGTPSFGSSIRVEGTIIKSAYKGQEIEMIAASWTTYGSCSEEYPFLYHHKHTSEYIRQHPHLRPRTKKISSILRIKSNASMSVHKFFQDNGFCFIHTPIITQNDCEGGGEVFTIETKSKSTRQEIQENSTTTNNSIEKALQDDQESEPENKKAHFFGAPAYLTVSGQLHLEAMACALTRVYNFGPAFRAEGSQTRLHSCEFQMIEAEIAFAETIDELLQVTEKCYKAVVESILNSCGPEIHFLTQQLPKHDVYMSNLLQKSFVKMTYQEAVSILQDNENELKSPIQYGDDLSTDHKLFLVRHCGNVPVFVCMFPSALKPFYMKYENDLASCFDLFALFGGEVCGGSLREDSEENLRRKFAFEDNPSLEWYLDLRRFGSVPHGGFGIGFERMLQSILGIPNIRDIVSFPRRKYDCKC